MEPKHMLRWIAMVMIFGMVGLSCEAEKDEGDRSDNTDDSDDDGWCDVVSDQEYACLHQCDAESGEECHTECVYLPPAEEGSCKDACAANLTICRDDCHEAYDDVGCPDEGNSPADNPSVDDDPDLSGDDDPDEDDDAEA
ncbi:MAG: hypothetical protein IT350_00295 [Deltaproteobacteria bacterium]|nr:hypothetical protein [Deltaproteobacteria bacterium]